MEDKKTTPTKKQEERLRKAAESYKEIEKLIAPFIGKHYKRLTVSEEWMQGDQRLARTSDRTR